MIIPRMKGRKYKALLRKITKITDGLSTLSIAQVKLAMNLKSLQKAVDSCMVIPEEYLVHFKEAHGKH